MDERNVMWAPVDGSGLEHLRLRQRADSYIADGVVIGVAGEQPFRI